MLVCVLAMGQYAWFMRGALFYFLVFVRCTNISIFKNQIFRSFVDCTVRWRGLPRNRTVVSWRLDSERSWRGFWDSVCAVFEVLVFLYLTHMGCWQPFIYPGLWKFQSVFCNIFRSVSSDVLVLVFRFYVVHLCNCLSYIYCTCRVSPNLLYVRLGGSDIS